MTVTMIEPELGSEISLDIDPGNCRTAEEAAKQLHEALRKLSKLWGQDPDIEIFIQTPEECARSGYGSNWRICWESGPYEWAIGISFQMTGPWGFCEPYHSFDLCFNEE